MITEKNLIHPNERKYFIPVVITSIFLYVLLIISISGLFFLLPFGLMSFILNGIMLANIRINGVKLSRAQFPAVYETIEQLCAKMNITKVPDVYVLQSDGAFNAFATKFFGRDMIVLYSEVFDLIEKQADRELDFIIAHELAHIQRRHIAKQMLIMPAMWIPFLSEAYQQGCEYTCDRYAAYYIENYEAARNTLTMMAIGKAMYNNVNKAEYIEQIRTEHGFFVWLAQRLSNHPPLPKRIQEISLLETAENAPVRKSKQWIPITIIVTVILAGIGFGIMNAYQYLTNFDLPSYLSEQDPFSQQKNKLIDAVINNKLNELNILIDEGEDLAQEDSDGWTALDWAIEDNNLEAVTALVNAGADVNHTDVDNVSPLMRAAYMGNTEIMGLLISNGSKLDEQDYYGETPLFYAVNYQQKEAVQLLLEHGADKEIRSSEDYTALMYAIQLGDREIVDLLRARD